MIAPLHMMLYLPISKESYRSATEYGASSISAGSPPMILPPGNGGNIDAAESKGKKLTHIGETLTFDKNKCVIIWLYYGFWQIVFFGI